MSVSTAALPLTSEQLRRRRRLSMTWAIVVVLWSLVRAVVVWAALSEYGVNPWAYRAIDLASAAVDGFTTPRFVLALIDTKYHDAAKWGSLTLLAFVVPDIYIFKTTHELPRMVVVVICIVIAVSLTVAVLGIVAKVRAGRHGHPDPAAIVAPRDTHSSL